MYTRMQIHTGKVCRVCFLSALSQSSDLVPLLLLEPQERLLPGLCRAVLLRQKLHLLSAWHKVPASHDSWILASQADSRAHHIVRTLQMSSPLGTTFQRTGITVMLFTSATLLVTRRQALDQHYVLPTGLE